MGNDRRWITDTLVATVPRLPGPRPRVAFHGLRLAAGRDDPTLGPVAAWTEAARRACAAPAPMVTVDVFDTVLYRSIVGQAALDDAIARAVVGSGGWDGSVEEYGSTRRAAFDQAPSSGVTEFYRTGPLSLRTLDAERCLGAEFEVERRLSRAVPGAASALATIRAAGKQVLFLSDMHLPAAFVASLLTASGARDDDPVVVSCEEGQSKATGDLFATVAGRYGFTPTDLVHIGNSLWSDGAQAVAAGVRPILLRQAEPTAREELLGAVVGSVGPVVAGAARSARLTTADNSIDRGLTMIGTSMLGAAMAGFLLWIRDRARAVGGRHVVFLARDTELAYLMAQAMPADHWEGLELHYVHGNRDAWMLAGAHRMGVDAWLDLWGGHEHSFLRQARGRAPVVTTLRRMGLQPEDIPDHLVDSFDLCTPLTAAHDGVWASLIGDEGIRALIAQRSAVQHALVTDYLRQFGLDQGRSVVVDIGWRGQLGATAHALLEPMSGHRPLNLHFGGSGVSASVDAVADFERFAFDDSKAPLPIPDAVMSVESFTSSGHVRAKGYRRLADGGVEAELSPPEPGLWNEHRAAMWEAAIAVASELPSARDTAAMGELDVHLGAGISALLADLWLHPTMAEALSGRLLNFWVDDADGPIAVAKAYGPSDFVGQRATIPRLWREASVCITPPVIRQAVRAYLRISGS